MSELQDPKISTPVQGESKMSSIEEYSRCFVRLYHLWKNNQKSQFKNQMQEYLCQSQDPYKMTFVCVKLCPELFRSKPDSLVANLIVELQKFISLEDNSSKFECCLTQQLQMEVYEVAFRQRHTSILKLLVKAYELPKRAELFLPPLRSKLIDQQYKEVCLFVTLLNLQSHFTTNELIVPLFLNDNLSLADDLVASSPVYQKELALFMDDIIGKKIKPSDLKQYRIKDSRRIQSNKILSGILAKVIKKYGLDPGLCPNFQAFRALGGLRYVFYKHYIEKSLQRSMFYSLINDTLKESPDILQDLLKLFVEYYDPKGSLVYVRKHKVPLDKLNSQIREALFNSEGEEEEEEEEVVKQSNSDYYTLDIPNSSIIMVDTIDKYNDCYKSLSESHILAIDSEWKPSFGVGNSEQAALLQFATLDKVFLIDLVTLLPILKDYHWQKLGTLFSNPSIIKLGYGIRGDFRVLGQIHPDIKSGFVNSKNVIDFDVTKNILLQEEPGYFSYFIEGNKGLSDLIHRCFGRSLDKRESFSNWLARPLTTSQINYAALDVRCLINAFNYLNQKVIELNLPDWKTLKKKPVDPKLVDAKKKKTPSKNKTPMKTEINTPLKGDEIKKMTKGGEREAINAPDFHVVCDTMIQGLAKQLRSCGVDAVALDTGEGLEQCVDIHHREKRVVLTKGKSYTALTKHIPHQYLYNVTTETAQDQLEEVIEAFKVKVTIDDVFARCSICNNDRYVIIPAKIMKVLHLRQKQEEEREEKKEGGGGDEEKEVEKKGGGEGTRNKEGERRVDGGGGSSKLSLMEKGMAQRNLGIEVEKIKGEIEEEHWIECEGGRVNLSTGRTGENVLINGSSVAIGIIDCTELFYVCSSCGKCYWQGSHHKKVLGGKLKNIVKENK